MNGEGDEGRLTYTVDEGAQRLGISRRHTWRLIAQGRIPVVRLGHRTLISRAALAAVLDAQADTPTPQAEQGRLHAEGSFAGPASVSEAVPRPQAGEQAQRQLRWASKRNAVERSDASAEGGRSDALLRVMT